MTMVCSEFSSLTTAPALAPQVLRDLVGALIGLSLVIIPTAIVATSMTVSHRQRSLYIPHLFPCHIILHPLHICSLTEKLGSSSTCLAVVQSEWAADAQMTPRSNRTNEYGMRSCTMRGCFLSALVLIET